MKTRSILHRIIHSGLMLLFLLISSTLLSFSIGKEHSIKSDALKVIINEAGCFDVIDLRTNSIWKGNRWTGSPGSFTYQVIGKSMDMVGGDAGPGSDNNFSISSKENRVELGKAEEIIITAIQNSATIEYRNFKSSTNKVLYNSRMIVELRLPENSDELIVTIRDLKVGHNAVYIQKINYPENFGALHTPTDVGYAVMPEEQGYIIPTVEIPRYSSVYMPFHRMMKEFSGNASREVKFTHAMPWFGMVKNESGWMGILESTDNANMMIVANRYPADKHSVNGPVDDASRIIGITPVWQTNEGEFGDVKVLRMKFFSSKTNYVAFTKIFRQYR